MSDSSLRRPTARFHPGRPRSRRAAVLTTALAASMAILVSAALAKTFTLNVAKHATVTNQSHTTVHESLVVTGRGFAVYTLSGERKSDPKCTKANGCFTFWPPVTVASMKKLSKASGISGKLGTWKRGKILQATLGGHPLYTFAFDTKKNDATGEGLRTFGGTWNVVKARPSSSSSTKRSRAPAPLAPAPSSPSDW